MARNWNRQVRHQQRFALNWFELHSELQQSPVYIVLSTGEKETTSTLSGIIDMVDNYDDSDEAFARRLQAQELGTFTHHGHGANADAQTPLVVRLCQNFENSYYKHITNPNFYN